MRVCVVVSLVLLSLALLYICILFGVAWYADRHASRSTGGIYRWFSRPNGLV